MADSPTVRLCAYVLGGPVYDLPLAFCASGNQNENMRAAFRNGATFYAAAGAILGIAGIIPTPASPFLLAMSPMCLAVAGAFKAVGDGRSPTASDVAGVASAGAPALEMVGGDPTGGQATEMAGAFEALAELADSTGLGPKLPFYSPPASSRSARDKKKRILKLKKARAKFLAIMKAKDMSSAKRDECRARGGVFDPAAPNSCRVINPGAAVKKKSSAGNKIAIGGIGLAIAKALGAF